MELWKRLILDWLQNCKLTNQNNNNTVNSLEKTDLANFFSGYKRVLNIPDDIRDLASFIKSNYPDFEIHFFVHENLCPSDYVFLYSLLIHHGCVTCCDESLQGACQLLRESQQVAVKVFLNSFLDKGVVFNRATLNKAIDDAVDAMHYHDVNNSLKEDCERLRLPMLVDADSTCRIDDMNNNNSGTPNYNHNNNHINSPLHEQLKGLVTVGSFESSYLVSSLKAKDDQINRLMQAERDHLAELADLRSKLYYGIWNEGSPVDELSQKGRMELKTVKRNNAMLEDKVANLLIELDIAKNDKSRMVRRLKDMGRDLRSYKERTNELTQMVEEYELDVRTKTRQIAELLETNIELEALLHENRNLLNKNVSGSAVNSSQSSFGDSSLNTSANVKSMNLGSCIIDLQLKDKEAENQQLQEELSTLRGKQDAMVSTWSSFVNDIVTTDPSMAQYKVDTILENPRVAKDFLMHLTKAIGERAEHMEEIKAMKVAASEMVGKVAVLETERQQLEHNGERMQKEMDELKATVTCYAAHEKQNLDSVEREVKQLQDTITLLQLEKEKLRAAIEKAEVEMFAKIKKIGKMDLAMKQLRMEKTRLAVQLKAAETNISEEWENKLEEVSDKTRSIEGQLVERENAASELAKANVALEERLREQQKTMDGLTLERDRVWKELIEQKQQYQQKIKGFELTIKDLLQDKVRLQGELTNERSSLRMSMGCEPLVTTTMATLAPEDGRESRGSLASEQFTSTPRLSMKAHVRKHKDMAKRLGINFFSIDRPTGSARLSSESDLDQEYNGYGGAETGNCSCGSAMNERRRKRRRRSNQTSKSSAFGSTSSRMMRNTMDQKMMLRLRRQKQFNRARETVIVPEDSIAWDPGYDFMAPSDEDHNHNGSTVTMGDTGMARIGRKSLHFDYNNNEEHLDEFDVIASGKTRISMDDLFLDIPPRSSPRQYQQQSASEVMSSRSAKGPTTPYGGSGEGCGAAGGCGGGHSNREDKKMSTSNRSTTGNGGDAGDGGGGASSNDNNQTTSMNSKTHSMNSGRFLANDKIPQTSVLHFSPRRTVPGCSATSDLHINIGTAAIDISNQMLLQWLTTFLIGVLVCFLYRIMLG